MESVALRFLSCRPSVSWLESPTWVIFSRLMRLTGTAVASDTVFCTVGLPAAARKFATSCATSAGDALASCGSWRVAVVRKAWGWRTAMRPATTPATAGIMTSSQARLPSTFR